MLDDDIPLGKKPPAPKNLENLSIEELEAYTQALLGEIDRVKVEIDRKKAYANVAASFFKTT